MTPVPMIGAAASADLLDALRRRGIRMLAAIGWVSIAMLVAADAWLGGGAGVAILVAGCAVNAGPTLMAVRGRCDAEARMLTGTLAAIIPAMLVFVLRGDPWQMDAHMYFFVAMAALVVLADWKPIALVSILVAVHHAALEWLVPAWVFTGSGNVGRLMFHVAAVGLQCAILGVVTVQLQRLIASQGKAVGDAREATRIAEEERRRALAAMNKVQAAEVEAAAERQRREDQARRTAEERRGELINLANEFERSVASVVVAIGTATARLESAAIQLDDTAGQAGREAGAVAVDAVEAAGEITRVASSIRSLSDSIVTIAAAADQQAGLTDAATREARRSVQTIAVLEEQAAEVEGFVEDIRRIAVKTNLLALNATIEAARAGEAGRGFAVVATEVKSLSADTTRASDKIIGLLTGIREGVADTGGKLRHVDGAIREVESAAGGISSAVDEQRGVVLAIDAGARRAVSTADDIEQLVGRVATAVGTVAILSNDLRSNVTGLAGSARALRGATDLFVSFLQTEQAA